MSGAVLDSSAVLAVFNDEAGGHRVIEWLEGGLLSSVNYAEVMTKLVEKGLSIDQARQSVADVGIEVIGYDIDLADRTGELRTATKRFGLSLADRACLALAERENALVLTADRQWSSLDLGIDVRVIR